MSTLNDEKKVRECEEQLKAAGIRYVQFQFTDILGDLRCMEEDLSNFVGHCLHGFGIDGSAVPGYGHAERSDVAITPEIDTFRIFKLDGELTARVMSHIRLSDGRRHPCDPRNILQKAIDLLASLGLTADLMSELEFILLKESDGLPMDHAHYTDMPPVDAAYKFRHELADAMTDMDIRVRRLHHECAPGQNEIEYLLTPAMKNSDDTVAGMWLTKLVGHRNGVKATFSPKPLPGEAGSGLHQHILVRDLKTGRNAMAGETGKEVLSPLALHFVAGMLKYARDITAIFAQTEECFKRLKPGFEAPIYAAWDFMNRTVLVRVPYVAPGKEASTRVEFRAGDGSGSNHLLSAAILYAGALGIRDKLPCPPNCPFNVEKLSAAELAEKKIEQLPGSLAECKAILEKSAFCHDLMGEEALKELIRLRNEPKTGHH